jgi:hypothetical protein
MTFIDGDFFENIADISFGDQFKQLIQPRKQDIIEKIKNIKNIPILYITTDFLINLLNEIRDIDREFIVIGHNADKTFADEIIPYVPSNVKRLWITEK